MGRNAAGESFLRGFLRYAKGEDFWLQLEKPEMADDVSDALKRYGRKGRLHTINRRNLAKLREPGCIYYPGPGLAEFAWQRAAFGHQSWSLCGITHTTSSARAMDAIAAWLEAPVQPWDAVICTSKAVKSNVERLLQAHVDYLKERLGVTKIVLPQLPVIPLGIHVEDFKFSAQARITAREQLGIGPDDIVVLYVGRLSFHAKAHPLPMYLALERAWARMQSQHAGLLPPHARLRLIECGWHANEHIAKAYRDAVALAAPSLGVLTLDGREAATREKAWASADVFCSLSDNIQETFGITPIEAMASGLPLVVSDWNGYKDSVRDAVDGFRIPSWMPHGGLGADLALRHALDIDSYDMYCGHSASFVSVDIEAATQAFVQLFCSPELRRQMGLAGRTQAQERFDWLVVMTQYEALWDALRELRASASPRSRLWPARLDPMHGFADYPSAVLNEDSVVCLSENNAFETFERLLSLAMVNYTLQVMPNVQEFRLMIDFLDQSPGRSSKARAVAAVLGDTRAPHGLRALAWLAKLGIVRFEGAKQLVATTQPGPAH